MHDGYRMALSEIFRMAVRLSLYENVTQLSRLNYVANIMRACVADKQAEEGGFDVPERSAKSCIAG